MNERMTKFGTGGGIKTNRPPKSKITHSLLSIVLSLIMVLSACPVGVFAAEGAEEIINPIETVQNTAPDALTATQSLGEDGAEVLDENNAEALNEGGAEASEDVDAQLSNGENAEPLDEDAAEPPLQDLEEAAEAQGAEDNLLQTLDAGEPGAAEIKKVRLWYHAMNEWLFEAKLDPPGWSAKKTLFDSKGNEVEFTSDGYGYVEEEGTEDEWNYMEEEGLYAIRYMEFEWDTSTDSKFKLHSVIGENWHSNLPEADFFFDIEKDAVEYEDPSGEKTLSIFIINVLLQNDTQGDNEAEMALYDGDRLLTPVFDDIIYSVPTKKYLVAARTHWDGGQQTPYNYSIRPKNGKYPSKEGRLEWKNLDPFVLWPFIDNDGNGRPMGNPALNHEKIINYVPKDAKFKDITFQVPHGVPFRFEVKGEAHYVPFKVYAPSETVIGETYDTYKYTDLPERLICHYVAGGFCSDGTKSPWIKTAQYMTIDRNPDDVPRQTLEFTVPEPPKRDNPPEPRDVTGALNQDDMYMNMPDSKYIEIAAESSEATLLSLMRVSQSSNNPVSNYFLEPDYNFILMGNSVEIANHGGEIAGARAFYDITPKKPGITVLRITYDPVTWLKQETGIEENRVLNGDVDYHYPSTAPADTGILIVNVVNGEPFANPNNLKTGIFQREYDTIYFDSEIGYGELKFKPESESVEPVSVAVMKPLHELSDEEFAAMDWENSEEWASYSAFEDGSFNVKLAHGRNIIRVSQGDTVLYHVVNAKQVKLNIENKTNRDWERGEPVNIGDAMAVSIEGISVPLQKLAGIYNPKNVHARYDTSAGGRVQSEGGQYSISYENEINFVISEPGEFSLVNGVIYEEHWGSAPDAHRAVSGGPVFPNLNAAVDEAVYSTLPDITFKVAGETADTAADEGKVNIANIGELYFEHQWSANYALFTPLGEFRNIDISNPKLVSSGFNIKIVPATIDAVGRADVRYWKDSFILIPTEGVETRELLLKENTKQFVGHAMDHPTGTGVSLAEVTLMPKTPGEGYPATYTFRRINPAGSCLHPFIRNIAIRGAVNADDMNFYDGLLRAEADIDLGYGFVATRGNHTTSVPHSVDSVFVDVAPLDEPAKLDGPNTANDFNDRKTKVNVAFEAGTVEDKGDNVWLISGLAEGENIITVTGTAPQGEPAETVSYTIKITRRAEPREIALEGAAEGASIILRDARGVRQNPISSGTWTYNLASETYTYAYSVPGYLTKTGTIEIADDTQSVSLPALSEMTPVTQKSGKVKVSVVAQNAMLRDRLSVSFDSADVPDLQKRTFVEYNYGEYTVLHAIIAAFESGQTPIMFTCFRGNLVPDIAASGILVPGAGWVCEVNGNVVPAGKLSTTAVKDGDDIRYYYNDNLSGMKYAWFADSELRAEQGASASFVLLGEYVNTDGRATPLSGAKILIDGRDSGERTNADGEATISVEGLSIGSHVVTATSDINPLTYNRLMLIVTKKPAEGEVIKTVSFRLIGAEKQETAVGYVEGEIEYQNWIRTVDYPVEGRVTVFEVFDWALGRAGLRYVEGQYNYISEIQAPAGYGGEMLGEFDNGQNSGWMYTVNGDHPAYGLREFYVEAGDEIVWHYVYDYKLETSFEGSRPPYLNGWLAVADTNPPTVYTPKEEKASSTTISQTAAIQGGKAEAVIDAKAVDAALEAAKAEAAGADGSNPPANAVTVIPTETGDAEDVTATLPKESVEKIADAGLALEVETPGGSVELPAEALAEIAKSAEGDSISVNVAKQDKAEAEEYDLDEEVALVAEVTVTSGGKEITSFGGHTISVYLPVEESDFTEGESYEVLVVSKGGNSQLLEGVCVRRDGKLFVKVDIDHLSTFIVTRNKAWSFTDVKGHWAIKGMRFAYNRGFMAGVSKTRFNPDGKLTRAMLVTMLHSLEGKPGVSGGVFSDVELGKWYTQGVAWAKEKGIVAGFADGTFRPEELITREQFATIMMSYARFKNQDVSKRADLSAYSDAGETSAWALDALKWAKATGLMSGRSESVMAPKGTATRAEAATILMNYIKALGE